MPKEKKKIILDFGDFALEAEIFNTKTGMLFCNSLPYTVKLMQWGNEVYGPIGNDLGEENPQPRIPAGGLAYTNQGKFVCVFFGQFPAWPVEYIGQIQGDSWKVLLEGDWGGMEMTIREG